MCMYLCTLHRALNLTLFVCLVPAGQHNTNYLGKWLMFVLKPICRWNVCYTFPFFNLSAVNSWLLPCTGDCKKLYQRKYLDTCKFKSQLHDGEAFSFVKLFVFNFFSLYCLIVFMSAGLEGTFQRADKWMGKGNGSAIKWRGGLSLLKCLKRLWWKR